MNENVITVTCLTKVYTHTGNRPVYSSDKEKTGEKVALHNVTFNVKTGERLAVIGSNGSGKSTLLSILSGLVKPTSGKAILCGHTAGILDIGANFHPELSGKENAAMFFRINGISGKELQRKLEETKEFSGLEDAFYNPVKTYSKGMGLRLSFTTAYLQKADIYLIDEVLSVGDDAFRSKVDWVMENLIRENKTLLFATHNRQEVAALSTRCLWIEQGNVQMDDSPTLVIPRYSRFQQSRFEEETKDLAGAKKILSPEKGNQGVSIAFDNTFQSEYLKLKRIEISRENDLTCLLREENIRVVLEIEKTLPGMTLSALIKIRDEFGHPVIHTLSLLNTSGIIEEENYRHYTGNLWYSFSIPANTITSGNYYLSVWFGKDIDKNNPHFAERAFYLPHEVQFCVSNRNPEFLSEPVHYSVQPALAWHVKTKKT